jgi:hypothetical protein
MMKPAHATSIAYECLSHREVPDAALARPA